MRFRFDGGGMLELRGRPSGVRTETGLDSSADSRVVASSIRHTSAIGRPAASGFDQPVMPSATRFRKVTLPSTSVEMTASPMQLSVTWARSFSMNNASSSNLRSIA
jgi:hypothetical protein